jgi:hypothetical protein
VIKAEGNKIEIEVKFSNPIFVSTADKRCVMFFYFSGKDFKSAGFGTLLK